MSDQRQPKTADELIQIIAEELKKAGKPTARPGGLYEYEDGRWAPSSMVLGTEGSDAVKQALDDILPGLHARYSLKSR